MLFFDRIRSLRDAKRITQSTMAKALGIGVPMYSRIERGERAIRKEQIQVLAKILATDFNELLKLWLADQVSIVMGGEEDKFNEVVTIAKSDIERMKTSKQPNNHYKGIDLFCGIGGFRLAMNDCDVDCVFSSDIDS